MLLFKADVVLRTLFLGLLQYQIVKPRKRTVVITVIVTPAMMAFFLDAGVVKVDVMFPDGCEVGALAESSVFNIPGDIALPLAEAEVVGEDDNPILESEAMAAPFGRSGAKWICNVLLATSPYSSAAVIVTFTSCC
jgi:hypothetical protein